MSLILPLTEARAQIMRTVYLDYAIGGWKGVPIENLFAGGHPLNEIELLVEAGYLRKAAKRLFITAQGVAYAETQDKEYCHA
ncbi:hypothetical protein EDC62_0220 [Tibeticola sediminis]|uniref:Uncharacterized protein n=1 Tax=Tibeticola sediminis TaxID=1917811 RepID=A0A3N4UY86_9BURK|nr:hypothetical protein [Tibeticola sediminis]RPE72529.1 hypothetical protein EDC62_0220 [Tibeticola sediminis]